MSWSLKDDRELARKNPREYGYRHQFCDVCDDNETWDEFEEEHGDDEATEDELDEWELDEDEIDEDE